MEAIPRVLNVEQALAACRGDPALAWTLIEQYRASLPEEWAALARASGLLPIGDRPPAGAPLATGGAYLGIERIALAAQRVEADILARAASALLEAAWRALEQAFEEFLAVPNEEWERRLRVVHRLSDGVAP